MYFTLSASTILTTLLTLTTAATTTRSLQSATLRTSTTTTTATSSSTSPAAPSGSPPTFALGQVYSRGSYSWNYIIWSPTFNTTASQCNNPASIAGTSAYTGPNHPFCNYPFNFDGYTNLTLQCAGQYPDFTTSVTGILLSNGTKLWNCTNTPLSNQYGAGAVQPYRCPQAGVDPDYQAQVSLFYICQ